MSLNIDKLTGINSNGARIYQKVENGIRTISSLEDGTITKEQEFETSGLGWTKPDRKHLNGTYQSVTTSKEGKIIEQEIYGNLDVMPTIIELA